MNSICILFFCFGFYKLASRSTRVSSFQDSYSSNIRITVLWKLRGNYCSLVWGVTRGRMRTKYKVYKKFSLHHPLPCRLDLVVQRVNTISAGAARDGNNDNCLYIYFHPPFVTQSGSTYWLQETWGLMKQKYGRERSLEKYLYNIIFSFTWRHWQRWKSLL